MLNKKDLKKQFRNALPSSTIKILSNLFIDHSQAPLVAFRATNSDQILVVLAEKKVILIQLPLRKKLALDNVNYGGNGNTQ